MINGIINLKKESGMTSHDAVFQLRKILHEKRIGHAGTLDPDVVGVLPIAVGKATRIIEYMADSGKVYRGTICLGYSTTTEDASGELVNITRVSSIEEDRIDCAIAEFIGEIKQIPPMYSAVKVNGKRLYEYARLGKEVERPERHVMIHSFKRTSDLNFKNECCYFDFEVSCSKGTYVRTLLVDLGKKLGYESHMSYLKRQASAGLQLENALTLSEIADKVSAKDFTFLLPIEYGVATLPTINLTVDQMHHISFGRKITLNRKEKQLASFYQGQLVAILVLSGDLYKPHKVFI